MTNDLKNWKQLGSGSTRTTPGYYREARIEDIGLAHIRLRVDASTSPGDFAILDLGVYTFEE